jgi:hypothetical protein
LLKLNCASGKNCIVPPLIPSEGYGSWNANTDPSAILDCGVHTVLDESELIPVLVYPLLSRMFSGE